MPDPRVISPMARLRAAVDAQVLDEPRRIRGARFLEVAHIGVADCDATTEVFLATAGQRGAKLGALLSPPEEALERLAQHQAGKLGIGLLARRLDAAEHGAENVREHEVVVANVGDHFAVFVFKGRKAAAQGHNKLTRNPIRTLKFPHTKEALEHGSSSRALDSIHSVGTDLCSGNLGDWGKSIEGC